MILIHTYLMSKIFFKERIVWYSCGKLGANLVLLKFVFDIEEWLSTSALWSLMRWHTYVHKYGKKNKPSQQRQIEFGYDHWGCLSQWNECCWTWNNFNQRWADVENCTWSWTNLYRCNHCDFSSALKKSLKVHTRRHNSEKQCKCDQCSYEGNQRTILVSHIRSITTYAIIVRNVNSKLPKIHRHLNRDKIKYNCDNKTTYRSSLNFHKQSKHEGIMYDCDQCGYKAAGKEIMKKHK